MRNTILIWILVLVGVFFSSCKEEVVYLGPEIYGIKFNIVDESGIDITESLYMKGEQANLKNDSVNFSMPSYQIIQKRDGIELKNLDNFVSSEHQRYPVTYIDNWLIISTFPMIINEIDYFLVSLCPNDSEPILLTNIFERKQDKDYSFWKYEDVTITPKNYKQTVCTFIRHENGTYSLKK